MGAKNKRARAADAAIDAVYAAVPAVACKGLCADNCCDVRSTATVRERERAGFAPGPSVLGPPCEKLTASGRCSVYTDRPWICRAYGAAEHLECAHGCRPVGAPLSSAEARKQVMRLLEIDDRYLGGKHDRA